MRETVCNFGPANGLFGILTTPDDDVKVNGAPIALILNAGIVHRVGPFRMHVNLARSLAAQGFSTMRIDLSGLGDSSPRTGKLETENRAEMDVADAMDFLTQQTGVEEFVLLGLCSGAYNSHKVSVRDKRIVGGVFMDGIVFRTFGYYLRQHVVRYLRPRFWRNAIKRRWVQEVSAGDEDGESLAAGEFFNVDGMTVDSVIKLMNRGVQMLFLYTDGYDDICGRSQFKEMYGFQPDDGQLQVEYYPKSEHTFRLMENRKAVCDRVSEWFSSQFRPASVN
jgi:pimeloyl-ACP methyl ester carboxylesterase